MFLFSSYSYFPIQNFLLICVFVGNVFDDCNMLVNFENTLIPNTIETSRQIPTVIILNKMFFKYVYVSAENLAAMVSILLDHFPVILQIKSVLQGNAAVILLHIKLTRRRDNSVGGNYITFISY